MRILNGITHATITVPTKAVFSKTNCSVIAEVFFGTKGSIGGIKYIKKEGILAWHTPMVSTQFGDIINIVPVFTGSLQVELSQLASKALARVKETFGSPKWDTKYLVLQDRVEVVPKEEESNAKN